MGKKKIIIISVIGIILLALILFLICGNKKYTVTFNYDNNTENLVLKVKKNNTVKLPKEPEKEGYTFNGWLYNGKTFNKNMKITKDITLKANWLSSDAKTFIVHFDTDGGSKIDDMIVEVGKELVLPSNPTKKGYTFDSWVDSKGKEVKDNAVLDVDDEEITLLAKWVKADEKKTYVVTFDTKGGSSISKMTVDCSKYLKLPKNPTKKGYTFVRWEDKNGTPIYNDANLACENITLYAVWEKEGSSDATTTKEVVYSCPSGYTLNGQKCTIEAAASESCPSGTYEYDGKCVTVTYDAREDAKVSCGKKTVHYGMGHTGEEQGVPYQLGTWYCYYGEVTPNPGQSTCTSQGRKWVSTVGKCYYDSDQNTTRTCTHLSNYVYIANPASVRPGATLNGGCYPIQNKTKSCESGYTLTNDKCVKTIDATAN